MFVGKLRANQTKQVPLLKKEMTMHAPESPVISNITTVIRIIFILGCRLVSCFVLALKAKVVRKKKRKPSQREAFRLGSPTKLRVSPPRQRAYSRMSRCFSLLLIVLVFSLKKGVLQLPLVVRTTTALDTSCNLQFH